MKKWSSKEEGVEEMINFLKDTKLIEGLKVVNVTGGGAHKFSHILEKELGVLIKCDEIPYLVKGMAFITNHCLDSSFSFSKEKGRVYVSEPLKEFPKILVSIGSGVSIIKINSYEDFKRISGTMIGGGTLLGLANLLIGTSNF